MEQSKNILDPLTYTISKNNGKFYPDRFELNINLPANTYLKLACYDISNKLSTGEIKNAVIIFIKSINDIGTRLPQRTPDHFPLVINNNEFIPYSANYRFDSSKDDCLVIIFHDATPTSTSIANDVLKNYNDLEVNLRRVTEDDPYSDNKDNGDKSKDIIQPRKLGMSLIKRG